jgi:predicted alpha-1,2-mannosidase
MRSRIAACAVTAVVAGLFAVPAMSAPAMADTVTDPTALVNPFIGTQVGSNAQTETPYGDTSPGATLPFGMVQFNPTTYDTKGGSNTNMGGYEYDADQLKGFSMNRVSGTGCAGRYGAEDFPILPYTGALTDGSLTVSPKDDVKAFYSDFSHDGESASPGRYSVTLSDGIKADLTATTRAGVGRFTFPTSGDSQTLVFDAAGSVNGSEGSTVTVDGNTISGSTHVQATCKQGAYYDAYFWASFDTTPTASGVWQDSTVTAGGTSGTSPNANGTGAYVAFAPGDTVTVTVGLSYVSVAGAKQNAQTEVGDKSWDQVADAAHDTWKTALNRIAVGGGDKAQLTTFYTAMYHSLLHPNVTEDVDGQYAGYDGTVHTLASGQKHEYATYSGWDIYRDEAQLIGLVFPNRASDINESILHLAQQAGWYNWPMLAAAQNKMNGDSLDIVMAELDAFGGTNYDRAAALKSMVDAQSLPASSSKRENAFQDAALGFIAENSGGSDHTSDTLEYALDDFAIAQLAKEEGDTDAYTLFSQRAQAWQNVYFPGNNAVTPRSKNGFDTGFDLDGSGKNEFIEASGTQYGWLVPQNVASLVAKKGGDLRFGADLDKFFTQLNAGNSSAYAYLSNEVSDQTPWLYNWIGEPNKTQDVVQQARAELWSDNTPTGIAGNDDLGATSAWYVWSSLGMFPALYGRSELIVNGPSFPAVTITSDNGRTYSIAAPGASSTNRYVTAMSLDGTDRSANWLPESFAKNGGTLSFTMSSTPGTWGTSTKDVPPSFSDGQDAYNNVGISDDGTDSTASFDASNNSFSAQALKDAGATPGSTLSLTGAGSGIEFTWPDVASGQADNWIPAGQNIDLGGKWYSKISFLGTATNGPSTGYAAVNYTDGTHQVVNVSFSDWTSGGGPRGEVPVLATAHRNSQSGKADTSKATVYASTPAVLDSAKKVASVTLPRVTTAGIMHIFAVGTAKASADDLTATVDDSLPQAVHGASFGATLATVSGGTTASADDYTVTVDWGDGSDASKDVALTPGADDGSYTVYGWHTFANAGEYTVTVKITDGTTTKTLTTKATVK